MKQIWNMNLRNNLKNLIYGKIKKIIYGMNENINWKIHWKEIKKCSRIDPIGSKCTSRKIPTKKFPDSLCEGLRPRSLRPHLDVCLQTWVYHKQLIKHFMQPPILLITYWLVRHHVLMGLSSADLFIGINNFSFGLLGVICARVVRFVLKRLLIIKSLYNQI